MAEKGYNRHPRAIYEIWWNFQKLLLVILFALFVCSLICSVLSPEPYIFNATISCCTSVFIILFFILFIIDLINLLYIPFVILIAFIAFALTMIVEKDIRNKRNRKSESDKDGCAIRCAIDRSSKLDAWEIYKQADNLYHQRFNFFMVAESMLVVSFMTALKSSNSDSDTILIAITILGMVFTLGWFYVNNHIHYRMECLLKEYLKPCNPIYHQYIEYQKGISSTFFMTDLLPFATFAFWCYLLYYTLV